MFKLIFNLIYIKMYDFSYENKNSFINLCQFFETQFLDKFADLNLHLRSLGIYPLDYASKWI